MVVAAVLVVFAMGVAGILAKRVIPPIPVLPRNDALPDRSGDPDPALRVVIAKLGDPKRTIFAILNCFGTFSRA
jgi:hypothetical protein